MGLSVDLAHVTFATLKDSSTQHITPLALSNGQFRVST